MYGCVRELVWVCVRMWCGWVRVVGLSKPASGVKHRSHKIEANLKALETGVEKKPISGLFETKKKLLSKSQNYES